VALTPCEGDRDCPDGTVCAESISACVATPGCLNDLDCPATERCDEFQCQPFTCRDNADCNDMFTCTGTRCVPATFCESDDDCLFGLSCINRFCADPDGCTSSAACEDGRECAFGACLFFPDVDCERDVDCGPGDICDYGWCQPSAVAE
jgi:hypothetical protein